MHVNDNTRNNEDHSRTPGRPTASRPPTPLPPLLALQSTAGNAAVVQMLRRAGRLPADDAEVQRSTVHDVLRTPGRPLDGTTRTDMETRLGADFSDVRIHNDTAARASAAEVGARAYTSGSHVVIGEGGADRHTLAHELTHVLQQRSGPVAGTDNGNGLKVSDPSDRYERAAEANARRAMSGGSVQRTTTMPGGQTAARDTVQRVTTETAVTITEGHIGEVAAGGTITYPSVTSCLTVTAVLRDGGKVGAHASLYQAAGGMPSNQILSAMRTRIGNRRVESIDISGVTDIWNEDYFRKAIEDYGEGEAPPQPTNDRAALEATVAKILNRQRRKVTARYDEGNLQR